MGKAAERNYTIKQSKALQAYGKTLKLLFLENPYVSRFYFEPDEDGSFDVRVCATLSLFIKKNEIAHTILQIRGRRL